MPEEQTNTSIKYIFKKPTETYFLVKTFLACSRSAPQVTKLFWPLNPTEKLKKFHQR